MNELENNSSVTETDNVAYVISGLFSGLRPPPNITISEWAEKNRILSSVASSEPGRWRNERTPYLKEIMDELSPQSSATDVVFMKGHQLGGTEVIINSVLYYIQNSPCPIGQFQTTELTAKRFVKQRENPAFAAMGVNDFFSGDEIYIREFPGGTLITGWSNSASNARSMPLRCVFCDEISEWNGDCGGQGDFCDLVSARTDNFPRKKRFYGSTPGIEGECKIKKKFLIGDQRHYFVPCPSCGALHEWSLETLIWDRDADGNAMPKTARMKCPECGHEYTETHKTEMMANGEWIAQNKSGAYPSFLLSSFYSPLGWLSWTQIVVQFIEAKNDIQKLKVFTNNILAQTWDIEGGKQLDSLGIAAHREPYDSEVPDGVVVLTAGIDTQDDRLEMEVVGWGAGLESWSIAHKVFIGDPAYPQVWAALDEALLSGYTDGQGMTLHIAAALVDSAGHKTDDVYRFTGPREKRNIYACIGRAGRNRAIARRPGNTKKSAQSNADIVVVGTDTAKDQLYDWLAKEMPGPGFCHFPDRMDEYTDEFFSQLTAEKRVKKWSHGQMMYAYKQMRPRNEALDCRVYARAALNLVGIDVDKMALSQRKFSADPKRSAAAAVYRRRMISGGVRI
jgi:phage terminase large subunit GpA-like protein